MKTEEKAIKPTQVIGLVLGVIAFVCAFYVLYLLREEDEMAESLSATNGGWLTTAYRGISLSKYVPGAFDAIKQYPLVHWAASYMLLPFITMMLVVFVVTYVLNVLLEKPQASLLEDPEYDYLHKGVKTPRINHMNPIMAVLPPRDRSVLIRDIALGAIDPFTPESRVSDIVDRPSTLFEN